ncbi:MAG: glutamate synthase-related protein [Candidatus Dormibacteria bacterium]
MNSSAFQPDAFGQSPEHDACALVAAVRKNGVPTHASVQLVLDGLVLMHHRSGEVDGEGDGCGIQVDLPRAIWARLLEAAGRDAAAAHHPGFVVGHFFVPAAERAGAATLKQRALSLLEERGFTVALERTADVNPEALGRAARLEEPETWQVALVARYDALEDLPARLFAAEQAIERETPLTVVSLSSHSAVYKTRGSAETLGRYYPELRSSELVSCITLGHNRYSTNTLANFDRVQPFAVLAHNGEINTVRRLRREAQMLGMQLVDQASDSQDLNRALEGLMGIEGLLLFEAMEIVFPPIHNDVKQLEPRLQDMYMFFRQLWGPFAQGPAAVLSRFGDECCFAVDALGLRPLWQAETLEEYVFSSEKGVVSLARNVSDPRPLAPGEKVGVTVRRGTRANPGDSRLYTYPELQQRVLERAAERFPELSGFRSHLHVQPPDAPERRDTRPLPRAEALAARDQERLLAAFGWDVDDVKMAEGMALTGREQIGSLGYDSPLAALTLERSNLADYFKENVAVVTNPAIDREREIEHFSTRTVLGNRPWFHGTPEPGPSVELLLPLLVGGHVDTEVVSIDDAREVADDLGTRVLEDLLAEFRAHGQAAVATIDLAAGAGEGSEAALRRLCSAAVAAARDGAAILLLDDLLAFRDGRTWIDPHLAVAAVDQALRGEADRGESLRRRLSIVLRSGAIRNLHDLVLALGLGADAINPYLLLELGVLGDSPLALENLCVALSHGLEKVISTLGIHELRGYARLVSSVGLSPALARVFEVENFCGSEDAGFGFRDLDRDSQDRLAEAMGQKQARVSRPYHLWPHVWKVAWEVAQGKASYADYSDKLSGIEAETPVSLRHLLDFAPGARSPGDADVSINGHSLPFEISSMSFGSQGETAFRAYAEAAKRLNMVCLNGEGGEIRDMMGRYRHWRGQQVASGRFGVNVDLANASDLLEIKIGQGAKPGEGGHLPGSKVSVKVAAARNARPGVDLISPSNNHDIYSIEDLAQIIEELKTANPRARVSVKVPVVAGIGTIAVGIAKSGADIITVSGFDGGTGAARKHALRHVGMPVEIGVKETHNALLRAGIRDRLEIWADGGVKSGRDVMKLILLGANRCGFGTLSMVAMGCTICRGCQLDTCHVGIATQMESEEEAARRGLKRFVPREHETAVEHLVAFFSAMGEELRALTVELGAQRTQDLVGRSDLLVQARGRDRVDLSYLVSTDPSTWAVVGDMCGSPGRAVRRPMNHLSELITREVARVQAGGEVAVFEDSVNSADRFLGTHLAGSLARERFTDALGTIYEPGAAPRTDGGGETPSHNGETGNGHRARLNLNRGSVPGNGLAAFNSDGIDVVVEGGAQDGVGKSALGGRVYILKGLNQDGQRVDGSVGKSFVYGAQRGYFAVQGDADSRAGIRLSGADVVIGGLPRGPLDDRQGNLASRANLKGFAFEYMTNGRAVVLGDPGPWICSGMTGGVVYLRLHPELGLDDAALRRRLAKGAKVVLMPIEPSDQEAIRQLLTPYYRALIDSGQAEEALRVIDMMSDTDTRFRKVLPENTMQVDQSVSTE